MSQSQSPGLGRHAIVIGSGIAGLTAARVLLDHFERVTVLERDKTPTGAELRAGAPQARHLHILLAGGERTLEGLFPGIRDELTAGGASWGDYTATSRVHFPVTLLPGGASGVEVSFASRPYREQVLRRRVEATGRVTVRHGTQVLGLLREGRGVSGIRLRDAKGEGELRADFVVAACGRDAKVNEWLVEIGYPEVRQETVDALLCYSTRWYRAPRSASRYNLIADLPSPPDRPWGGGFMACENDQWIVTLMGIAGQRTPMDEEGFHEWVRGLRFPEVWKLLMRAEPMSGIYGSAKTENRHRHFEELREFPERFVVLGDAVASFNPMYGQGMTMAVIGVMELRACLEEQRRRIGGRSLAGLSKRFQRRLARSLRGVWAMAIAEDFRWPETEGERPGALSRAATRYFDELLHVVREDDEVFRKFIRAQHMLDPVTSLLSPAIASRVLERATRPARESVRERVRERFGGLWS